jgi:hypothetical protein
MTRTDQNPQRCTDTFVQPRPAQLSLLQAKSSLSDPVRLQRIRLSNPTTVKGIHARGFGDLVACSCDSVREQSAIGSRSPDHP